MRLPLCSPTASFSIRSPYTWMRPYSSRLPASDRHTMQPPSLATGAPPWEGAPQGTASPSDNPAHPDLPPLVSSSETGPNQLVQTRLSRPLVPAFSLLLCLSCLFCLISLLMPLFTADGAQGNMRRWSVGGEYLHSRRRSQSSGMDPENVITTEKYACPCPTCCAQRWACCARMALWAFLTTLL